MKFTVTDLTQAIIEHPLGCDEVQEVRVLQAGVPTVLPHVGGEVSVQVGVTEVGPKAGETFLNFLSVV